MVLGTEADEGGRCVQRRRGDIVGSDGRWRAAGLEMENGMKCWATLAFGYTEDERRLTGSMQCNCDKINKEHTDFLNSLGSIARYIPHRWLKYPIHHTTPASLFRKSH